MMIASNPSNGDADACSPSSSSSSTSTSSSGAGKQQDVLDTVEEPPTIEGAADDVVAPLSSREEDSKEKGTRECNDVMSTQQPVASELHLSLPPGHLSNQGRGNPLCSPEDDESSPKFSLYRRWSHLLLAPCFEETALEWKDGSDGTGHLNAYGLATASRSPHDTPSQPVSELSTRANTPASVGRDSDQELITPRNEQTLPVTMSQVTLRRRSLRRKSGRRRSITYSNCPYPRLSLIAPSTQAGMVSDATHSGRFRRHSNIRLSFSFDTAAVSNDASSQQCKDIIGELTRRQSRHRTGDLESVLENLATSTQTNAADAICDDGPEGVHAAILEDDEEQMGYGNNLNDEETDESEDEFGEYLEVDDKVLNSSICEEDLPNEPRSAQERTALGCRSDSQREISGGVTDAVVDGEKAQSALDVTRVNDTKAPSTAEILAPNDSQMHHAPKSSSEMRLEELTRGAGVSFAKQKALLDAQARSPQSSHLSTTQSKSRTRGGSLRGKKHKKKSSVVGEGRTSVSSHAAAPTVTNASSNPTSPTSAVLAPISEGVVVEGSSAYGDTAAHLESTSSSATTSKRNSSTSHHQPIASAETSGYSIITTEKGFAVLSDDNEPDLIIEFMEGLPRVKEGTNVALLEYLLSHRDSFPPTHTANQDSKTRSSITPARPQPVKSRRRSAARWLNPILNNTSSTSSTTSNAASSSGLLAKHSEKSIAAYKLFLKTYLLSFRAFLPETTLAKVLLNQVRQHCSDEGMGRCVLTILEQWIDTAWCDFVRDPVLIPMATQIISAASNVPNVQALLSSVRATMNKKLNEDDDKDGEGGEGGKREGEEKDEEDESNASSSNKEGSSPQQRPPNVPFPRPSSSLIIVADALQIAEQLTMFNSHLFQRVHVSDFVLSTLNSETSDELTSLITRFDQEYYWVMHEVLSVRNVQTQQLLVEKFIQVATHCKGLHNFYSVFAIASALDSAKLQKLPCWNDLSKEALKAFSKLQHFISPDKNMKVYRHALKRVPAKMPRIPFLPIVMKDLRFIADSQPSKTDNLINFERVRSVVDYASGLQRELDIKYAKLSKDPDFQRYFTYMGSVITALRKNNRAIGSESTLSAEEERLQMEVASLIEKLDEKEELLCSQQESAIEQLVELEKELLRVRSEADEREGTLTAEIAALQARLDEQDKKAVMAEDDICNSYEAKLAEDAAYYDEALETANACQEELARRVHELEAQVEYMRKESSASLPIRSAHPRRAQVDTATLVRSNTLAGPGAWSPSTLTADAALERRSNSMDGEDPRFRADIALLGPRPRSHTHGGKGSGRSSIQTPVLSGSSDGANKFTRGRNHATRRGRSASQTPSFLSDSGETHFSIHTEDSAWIDVRRHQQVSPWSVDDDDAEAMEILFEDEREHEHQHDQEEPGMEEEGLVEGHVSCSPTPPNKSPVSRLVRIFSHSSLARRSPTPMLHKNKKRKNRRLQASHHERSVSESAEEGDLTSRVSCRPSSVSLATQTAISFKGVDEKSRRVSTDYLQRLRRASKLLWAAAEADEREDSSIDTSAGNTTCERMQANPDLFAQEYDRMVALNLMLLHEVQALRGEQRSSDGADRDARSEEQPKLQQPTMASLVDGCTDLVRLDMTPHATPIDLLQFSYSELTNGGGDDSDDVENAMLEQTYERSLREESGALSSRNSESEGKDGSDPADLHHLRGDEQASKSKENALKALASDGDEGEAEAARSLALTLLQDTRRESEINRLLAILSPQPTSSFSQVDDEAGSDRVHVPDACEQQQQQQRKQLPYSADSEGENDAQTGAVLEPLHQQLVQSNGNANDTAAHGEGSADDVPPTDAEAWNEHVLTSLVSTRQQAHARLRTGSNLYRRSSPQYPGSRASPVSRCGRGKRSPHAFTTRSASPTPQALAAHRTASLSPQLHRRRGVATPRVHDASPPMRHSRGQGSPPCATGRQDGSKAKAATSGLRFIQPSPHTSAQLQHRKPISSSKTATML